MLTQATIDLDNRQALMSLPARILTFLMDRRAASSREIMEALSITVEASLHGAVKRLIDQGRIERKGRGQFQIMEDSPDGGKIPFEAWLRSRNPGEIFRLDRVVSEVKEPYQVVTQRMETLLRSGAIGRTGRGVYAVGTETGEGTPHLSLFSKSEAVRRIMSREDRVWKSSEIQACLKEEGVDAMASQVLGNMAKNGLVIRVAKGAYVLGRRQDSLS